MMMGGDPGGKYPTLPLYRTLSPDEGPWEFLMRGNQMVKRRPWCDCAWVRGAKKVPWFTKREDGVWVHPCCMRRERAAWEREAGKDNPAPDVAKWLFTMKEN